MRSGLNFIAQQQGSSKVGLLAGGPAGAKNGEMQRGADQVDAVKMTTHFQPSGRKMDETTTQRLNLACCQMSLLYHSRYHVHTH